MSRPYLDQIDSMIAAHRQTIEALQREIYKLEGAAEVIAQLRGNDGIMALDVTPERKISGAITIRKKAAPTGERVSSAGMEERAAAALTIHKDGLGMKQLAIAMGLQQSDKRVVNRLWYALNSAIKAGKFTKEGNLYKLPPQKEEPDAA
jgi:hypothetical protein